VLYLLLLTKDGTYKNFSYGPPASNSVGAGAVFPVVKWPARGADHLPPSLLQVKNEWMCMYPPPHAVVVCTGITLPLSDHLLAVVNGLYLIIIAEFKF
jgi:hypothetical protein